jgi:triacylglycerol lipase
MELLDRLRIPVWLEARAPVEHAMLLRDPVARGEHVPPGGGAPVMLISGFLAGDASLGPMARWLRDVGYRPCRAGIRANVDCTERTLVRLEGQLERVAERHGRRVAVVGQSRGGMLARVLAVRRPDLIGTIICLGSPLADQFALHPLVRGQLRAVAALGSLGVPGLFSYSCRDDCCAQADHELTAPFPEDVRFVSVFSRSDGIVDWRACLDPAAEAVEVRSSHIGMAVNADVYRVLAATLGGWAESATVAYAA